jgi:hypothetical protein
MDIMQSTDAYEAWLRAQLRGEIVEDDIARKHKKMADAPFPFLRATYWRWAETILEDCPDLATAPPVLAVGDIHLENFGTWRDEEGRLVWGVNDFDEAAVMPYTLDLVRLATSAALAGVPNLTVRAISDAVLQGYAEGLADPHALVLDRRYGWLRKTFEVSNAKRTQFWEDNRPEANLKSARKRKPPRRYVEQLKAARPDTGIALVFWPRTAGAGSLGRPRWIGYSEWRGAPLLREAKAVVPSGWTRAHGGGRGLHIEQIAAGKHRSPDPWYRLADTILVRRLSPNNRKLDLAEVGDVAALARPKLLQSMGRDLAAIHLGTGDHHGRIDRDLRRRKTRWLRDAVEAAAERVRAEQKAWKKAWKAAQG